MNDRHYKHLFGPVPSRRLGRSLGLDLVPFKTCSFDCIFCQLGRTTRKTSAREEYVPADEIIAELDAWLRSGDTADYITLAGSGEPTLNREFGKVIEFARSATRIPVALLTNGSLLTDPEVRMQAAQANVVKVSLSAWNQVSLEHVNRPAAGIDLKRLVEGQRLFRRQFQGELWLEVFLVWGTNATPKDVAEIARLAKAIGPDKVQNEASKYVGKLGRTGRLRQLRKGSEVFYAGVQKDASEAAGAAWAGVEAAWGAEEGAERPCGGAVQCC